jgi:two-component system CheB/CheR fusion protein
MPYSFSPSLVTYSASCPAPAFDEDYAEETTQQAPHDVPVTLPVKASSACLLVVDDAPDVLHLLASFFRLSGYEVETANSAFMAFGAAKRRHFDAVVSDIGLPYMTGYDLASALRSLPGYGKVPLVAVTGFAQYDDVTRARRAGFDAHMKKPLDLSRLAKLVEDLLPS